MTHSERAAVLLAAMACLPCGAAADAEDEAESRLENVLVTGTFNEVPRANLTSSVSVLDSTLLRALNKRSVSEVLKTVPGVLVEETGGPGGLTAVSIRGGEANFTLVLLDGVAVNDPTNNRGGSFDFTSLDPADVERIEIVRGPQSAIYGSDALAGVINIITRRGTDGHQQQLRAEWGEDDFENYRVAASGRMDSFSYAASFAHRDEGEPAEGSTREFDVTNLRLDWAPIEGHALFGSVRHLDGDRSAYPEQSGGPEFAVRDELDTGDFEDTTFALGWRADFTTRWRSTVTATHFEHKDDYDSPGIFPYNNVPPNAADNDFERDQLQWVNTLTLSENYRLNLGGEYRDETGDSEGSLEFGPFLFPTDFSLDRDTASAFIDGSATLGESLLLQGSLRYDDPDDFDSETSVKLGARYRPTPNLSLTANWGEAFKLPSFAALGHPLVGNPDLKPETAESWDAGFTWYAAESLELGATWFFNDYEDLIDFDAENFRNVNRSQVETSGVEALALWQPLDTLSLQAHATYTDIDVKNQDTTLLGRPEWKAGAVAVWQFREDWRATLDYLWTDELYAASLHTGETVVQELDSAHRVDLNVNWQVLRYLSVEFSVDNVFDEDYETAVGFPAPGRSARMSLSLQHR